MLIFVFPFRYTRGSYSWQSQHLRTNIGQPTGCVHSSHYQRRLVSIRHPSSGPPRTWELPYKCSCWTYQVSRPLSSSNVFVWTFVAPWSTYHGNTNVVGERPLITWGDFGDISTPLVSGREIWLDPLPPLLISQRFFKARIFNVGKYINLARWRWINKKINFIIIIYSINYVLFD